MLWIISWQLLVLAAELTEFFRKVNFHLCRCKCFRNCGGAPRRRITHAEVSWLMCLMPAAPASEPVSKPQHHGGDTSHAGENDSPNNCSHQRDGDGKAHLNASKREKAVCPWSTWSPGWVEVSSVG